MAKLRVYELAKDLNMTNKALLNKLKELNIDAKSHMSSLEDSAVKQIKTNLFGKSRQKEDLKVRPSVIRRRKKKVVRDPDVGKQEKSEMITTAPVPDVDTQATDVAEGGRQTGSDTPEAPPVSPEKESEVKDVPGPSTSPDTSKPEKKPSVKKQKSEPARIIKPAKIVLPLKPAKKEPTPESVLKETEAQKPKASAVKPTDVTDERKGPDSPERQPVEDKPMAAKATPEVSSAPETGAVTDENAETDAEKADDGQQKPELSQEQSSAESEEQKTSKKKKKKRKSIPAKIVKKADPVVLENIRKTKAEEEKKEVGPERSARPGGQDRTGVVPNGPDTGVPFIPGESDPGFRKKDRRKDDSGDGAFDGKRKKRKKKSVVEGEELYRGRGKKEAG